ncbi:hypothetical protein CCHR01_10811 [Colletotrichum chrysophilum]|uniref:Uncharacterized protein n=1 Tax=Colletotrichum chrysophilum TaxID=1836956 RepID=A0AAD9ECY6_9PEZI|nr:hypothetical protein K456DRAFT_30154 [Colletotrichum gloeosporioides 23]KAK1846584.1 hypothetical protein CCHR01_10811 [Colletotrichum chrysophilum]
MLGDRGTRRILASTCMGAYGMRTAFCGDGNLTVGPCLNPTGSISLGGASRRVVLVNEGSNRAGRGKFSLGVDGMTRLAGSGADGGRDRGGGLGAEESKPGIVVGDGDGDGVRVRL